MNYKKFIALIVLTTMIVSLPLRVVAQGSVPTVDTVQASKEVGITVFGFTIPGLGWDTLAILAAKQTIQLLVDSTVDWINTGFEGNPAYVTNPGGYFGGIADGIAGEFIEGSDLEFLCSPFQAKIRLSLAQAYVQPRNFQCTLTDDVLNNLENFYGDFSQGGWDSWIAISQSRQGNPYGAYLDARVELDSRIAEKIGLERTQLEWDSGFLAWSDCVRTNPIPGEPGHQVGKVGGECLERGPTKTPGKVIESQLEGVLATPLKQLELADEFDELIGALLGELLQTVVFGAKGLFDGEPQSVNGTDPPGAGGIDFPENPGGTPPGGDLPDIDNDGVPDGTDEDGDGDLDICFFGGENGGVEPPCRGSGGPPGGGGGGGGEREEREEATNITDLGFVDTDGDGINRYTYRANFGDGEYVDFMANRPLNQIPLGLVYFAFGTGANNAPPQSTSLRITQEDQLFFPSFIGGSGSSGYLQAGGQASQYGGQLTGIPIMPGNLRMQWRSTLINNKIYVVDFEGIITNEITPGWHPTYVVYEGLRLDPPPLITNLEGYNDAFISPFIGVRTDRFVAADAVTIGDAIEEPCFGGSNVTCFRALIDQDLWVERYGNRVFTN